MTLRQKYEGDEEVTQVLITTKIRRQQWPTYFSDIIALCIYFPEYYYHYYSILGAVD